MKGEEPTWTNGEPFPHSRKQIARAGDRIRRTARDGKAPDDAALQVVDDFRRLHLPVVEFVQSELSAFFHRMPGIPEDRLPVTSRLKTPPAIVSKLCRSQTSLLRMQDIAGARVVVAGLSTQDLARQAVTDLLFSESVARVKDQREAPDKYGYRAIHVIVTREDLFAEIQIRTSWQDRWAQIVEVLDSRNGWDLKHGRGPAEWLEWLHELGDAYRSADLEEPYTLPPTPFEKMISR